MKKVLVYVVIILPIILVWLHWGGFKNDIGTLMLSMIAVLNCTIATDKMNPSAEDAEDK